jgi:hypothetical protein
MSDEAVSRTEVRFNAIYVLESLPEGDPKTGQALFDDIVFPHTRKLDGVEAEFWRVRTEDELRAKLREIERRTRLEGRQPIVHFETHGFDTGLELADGSFVEWTALIPALVAINHASRMNLLVVAMLCRGWSLMAALTSSDRAALLMLVAPPKDMTHAAILSATKRFYEAIVARLDLNDGLEAMNEHRPYADWPIKPGLSEILLWRHFRSHLEGLTPEIVSAETNSRVANIARQRNLDLRDTAVVREDVRRFLLDHPARYDRLRRMFLMLDLYPENEWKFGLTYEKCLDRSENA